ncbi:MAG: bifunctional demethylmenaquinone methyltransferase/2-methoxy-6-polyprenyl-1,4-benzoquinol methylase UbiE [Prevotellaceae bacterium]|jgi:demethylmenaquinone methyltransferase/2-methoxy-6-polyprenyl-1,4-benzoquinol methylase|nr:bifunctional demethylmenaquinone methyltransferase/2-methoxy-6-polyprenyl-1,4-benzoquinol methylase UbiE [Prevotellaceae bacterium]
MKKEKVSEMFDSIASKYDFLNGLLSLGTDKIWRRKLRGLLDAAHPSLVLDVAAGTGDLAVEAVKKHRKKVVGIDISEKMLAEGRRKIARKHLDNYIELLYGDAENLQFASDTFDAVTVAFGVRNFENREKGLSEIHRVTKPSGRIFILDFAMPRNPCIRFFYKFYFNRILPLVGKLFSRNFQAYKYLPESVENFPQYEQMTDILKATGYVNTRYISLSFGIAAIYSGEKP